MKTYTYPVEVTPDDQRGWTFSFVDFENTLARGLSHEEARVSARYVLEMAILDCFKRGHDLPTPSEKPWNGEMIEVQVGDGLEGTVEPEDVPEEQAPGGIGPEAQKILDGLNDALVIAQYGQNETAPEITPGGGSFGGGGDSESWDQPADTGSGSDFASSETGATAGADS